MSEDAATTDIRPLDPETVAQIAAGEVVERPASVVKELVENSLDAGANRIDVSVEAGGIEAIRVTDDGAGMTRADVRAAVREHTTSKLRGADELDCVATLGFRGEALHTIGAVATMTIRSRAHGEETGTELVYRGNTIESVEPVGHPEGTTVEVTDLFFNTPARRKYLGEPATEFRHVNRVVSRYALANPDVAISLSHDGSEVFSTPGRGDRLAAIMAVYGRSVAESMVEVEASPDPVDQIYGYVSEPETTRASREYLATYVNERYVEPTELRNAIVAGYGGQLAGDRYPFAVLFVDLPREAVDVNVHPRKMQVRFEEEGAVTDAVEGAVRQALLEADIIRSSAPRGRSAPDVTPVSPGDTGGQSGGEGGETAETGAGSGAYGGKSGSSGPRDSPGDAPAAGAGGQKDGAIGGGRGDSATSPAQDASHTDEAHGSTESGEPAQSATGDTEEETDSASARGPGPRTVTHEQTEHGQGSREAATDEGVPSQTGSTTGKGTVDGTGAATPECDDPKAQGGSAGVGGVDSGSAPDLSAFGMSTQATLDGEAVDSRPDLDSLPRLRILGQLSDTYLVCVADDRLLLVDQHAADERIHYERLRKELDSGMATQALASPVTLSLTPDEAAVWSAYAEALAELGFEATRDGETVTVESVPAVFDRTLEPEHLYDVLSALLSGDQADGEQTIAELAEDLLADMACSPAVTGNVSLTDGSIQGLIEGLDACDNPYACPHGRPTIIAIDKGEIDDRFERDYPGHQ